MNRITRFPRYIKVLILIGVDAVLAVQAYWFAVVARYGQVPSIALEQFVLATGFAAVLMPIVALGLGMYRPVTRFYSPVFASQAGMVSALCGALLAAIAVAGGAQLLTSLGFGAVFGLVAFALLLTSRAVARWILRRPGAGGTPVAIYGAGEAGRQLAALLSRGIAQRAVAFIDDDRSLRGRSIEGLPVIDPKSGRFQERLRSRGVREILIAVPSLSVGRRRELLEFLSELPYRVRSVPRLAELAANGGKGVADLVEISVEELLGRDPVMPLPGLLESCIRGRTVLVTGGGGTIGAELCRQVLSLAPSKLVVLDHSEFALYCIEQELLAEAAKTAAATQLRFVLGSVNDWQLVRQLFEDHAIETVYHAAAYKHVPIVELNPLEGFRNNALGTWNVARAAAASAAKHFVLVSTDKAVRPTNVMGASKRIAELAIQAVARRSTGTTFATVRFGNVLASSGSVVPLFTKQIAAGGPVTLTHTEATRYFMTIREAVELVIQAGAMAKGCDLFVLDMGMPVRIGELAERLVRLSGRTVRNEHNPGGDIAIEVTGLRPGEKLHEELLIDGDITGTLHPRILQARESTLSVAAIEADLARLEPDGRDDAAHAKLGELFAKWVAGNPVPEKPGERLPLRVVPPTSERLSAG